jgi:hypothetical protein
MLDPDPYQMSTVSYPRNMFGDFFFFWGITGILFWADFVLRNPGLWYTGAEMLKVPRATIDFYRLVEFVCFCLFCTVM